MADPEAAVAIVHARGAAESVLLMRRTEREGDPWSGHWSFPGGRREPEDGDLFCTALRELYEECGIQLARENLETALPPMRARRTAREFLLVAPFVLRVDEELSTLPGPEEAVEALWVPLSLLRDPARHALRPVPGMPADTLFPAVDLNGVPLWGFTYRLITKWLGLGPDEHAAAQAGFHEASLLLEFLVDQGMELQHGWVECHVARTAAVKGPIPVAAVLAYVAAPTPHIPRITRLQVLPGCIRLLGPVLEEYTISSVE